MKHWLLILLGWSWGLACAQSPYQLSAGNEIPLLGGSLLFSWGVNRPLEHKMRPLMPEDTVGLNILKVPGIDRFATKYGSEKAGHTSDIFLKSSLLAPVALPLLAGNSSRHKMGVTYLIVFEGLLVSATLTEFTKVTAQRKRPYVYGLNGFDHPEELFTKESKKSFFSGHTSITATNTFMAAKMFQDFYPDSNLKPVVWTTAALWPAITGFKRVQAGKHFLTDVLAGYAVGAIVGIVIPELHK